VGILERIWELPWYKVLVIAVIDDVILFVKLWPAYVALIIIGIGLLLLFKLYFREQNE